MITKKYQNTTAPIVSYDYTDIEEGTGTVVFYGSVVDEDAVSDYVLSKNIFNSKTIEIASAEKTMTADYVEHVNIDFEVSFNVAKTVKGHAYLTGSFDYYKTADANQTAYWKATLNKVSGGVETEIGSSRFTDAVSSDRVEKTLRISLTETDFKPGDILRLTILAYGKYTSAGVRTAIYTFGADPKNRDRTRITPSTESDQTTQLKLYVPFKLNL